ncbi:MAG: hypothetical protein IJZ89_07885 [Clostridia bacterium]|nr:hypothetical protein [Clostridia bacterium]
MINGLYANDNAALKASLINVGDLSRIKNVISKAKAGKPITLGFLGGSITQGSGSTDGMHYVRYTTDFWKETFPGSEITCVNAGMGATGSILGVFRMEKDVLSAKPDVLVIDHSVNDNGDESRVPGSTKQTYECVIRRGLLSGAAVVPLCVCSSDGNSQRDMNLELAKHYDLPFVSMFDGIYEPLIKSGKYNWSSYSNDSVHPNPAGHPMLAELLKYYFKLALDDESEIGDINKPLPTPLFGQSYMNTEMLDGSTLIPDSYGAFKVGNTDFYQFKGGWTSEGGGDAMTFVLKDCKVVHIAYVKNPAENSGTATVTANGEIYEVDTFFKNGWGKYAETKRIFASNVPADVTVSIKPNDEGKIFPLLRVMVAR